MKTAIVGIGSLGRAFARAVLDARIVAPEDLTLVTRSPEKIDAFAADFCCPVISVGQFTDSGEKPEVVILVVKPQDAAIACEQIRSRITEKCGVLSLMAGISLPWLTQKLTSTKQIMRAMPNLCARVQKSATAYYVHPDAAWAFVEFGERLLKSIGDVWKVYSDEAVDAVTALSGSGPAYLCWMIEEMTKGGEACGLPRALAQDLSIKTLVGTGEYLVGSSLTPEKIRRMVTSKGGTTEAALEILRARKADDAVVEAVRAAFDRARLLSSAR